MRVKITEFPALNEELAEESYIAESEDDCRCETDKTLYRIVVEHQCAIHLGCLIGEPEEEAL